MALTLNTHISSLTILVGLNSRYLIMNIHTFVNRCIQCYVRQDLAVSIKLILNPLFYAGQLVYYKPSAQVS